MRLPASALASIAVHAALLALAAVTLLPSGRLVEVVRVSLRDGAGANGGNDGHSAGIPAAPPAPRDPAPVPAAIPAAVKPQPPPHRIARHRAAAVNRAINNTAAAPAPVADSVVVDAAGTAAAPSAGSVAAGGVGSGGAAGAGSGSGFGGDSDQRAYCVYCPEPGYPLIARRRGWQGTVDVGLELLADGRVESASVRRSSGYDTLDREAIDVARRSRFRLPDGSAGAPVHGRIEYHFELVGPR